MAVYPLLRTTLPQPDPGLVHTLPISNVTELQNMNLNLAGHYYLTGNIDASDTINWNGGAGFVPIGPHTTEYGLANRFIGTFDGCGYKITNLFINRGSGWNVSLFGCISSPAVIANVTLENVSITGDDYYTASLVSECTSYDAAGDVLIQNCHASGIIASYGTGFGYCGGLIGRINRKTGDASSLTYLYDSSSACELDMSSATNYNYRGGFVGYAIYAVIKNCYATGDLTGGNYGKNYFGGFAGVIRFSSVSFCYSTGSIEGVGNCGGGFAGFIGDGAIVSSCYSTGDVGGNTILGGFGGQIQAGDVVPTDAYVTDCYSWGDAAATGTIVGGFCGASANTHNHFTNCYSKGSASGTGSVGGFIGDAHPSLDVESCYWDKQASGNPTTDEGKGEGHITVWFRKKSHFTGWDFDLVWYMPDFGRQIIMGRPRSSYPMFAPHTVNRNVYG